MAENANPVRWLAFAGAAIAAILLLMFLPPPAATVSLFAAVVIAGVLALNRAGYAPSTYHIFAAHWIHRFYQTCIIPILTILRAFALINLRIATPSDAPVPPLHRMERWVGGEVISHPSSLRSMPRNFFSRITRHALLITLRIPAELCIVLLTVAFATQRFYTSPGLQLSGGETEWITSSAYAAHDGLVEYGRIPLWQPYLEFGEPLVDNPVTFILNPFSTAPSLLLGGADGMKISVVLTTAVAGLGGWFLGYTLGFGTLARVLLALLLVGKGNMSAMFHTGYFQLASSQAYFPWIIAGVLGIFLQPRRRWPPVMLAVSAALLLFAGNVWFTLPLAFCVAAIALVYLIRPISFSDTVSVGALHAMPMPGAEVSPSLRSGEGAGGRGLCIPRTLHSLITRHSSLITLLFAALLTLTISAANLLPIWMNQGQVGKHPPEVEAGWVVPLWKYVVPFYVNPYQQQKLELYDPTNKTWQTWWTINQLAETYYSFITPLWFLLLIGVAIPLYRPRWNRLWWLAWIFVILFTLWGAGGQQPFLWLYQHIPFLRGWRFVGRALAVGSFWIAVLIAMRVDSLWRIITTTRWNDLGLGKRMAQGLPLFLCGALIIGSGRAAYEVNQQWHTSLNNVINPINVDDVCVSWLRAQNPDRPLTIWRWDYEGVTTLMNNRVRIFDVLSDFEMSPMPRTMGNVDLTRSLPEFGIAWSDGERAYLTGRGYVPMPDSPRLPRTQSQYPCLYRKADTLSYAYTVSVTTLQEAKPPPPFPYGKDETLPPHSTTPITTFQRQPDNILLVAEGDPNLQTILTIQERAYPGWRVEIDGKPAKLQSVGGQIGVFLPRDPGLHAVYFEYRPPLLITGAWITLMASIFCMLYLLRADRIFRPLAAKWFHGR